MNISVELNKHQKLLIFVIALWVISLYLLSIYYEAQISSEKKIKGGMKKEYTADDILTMIKSSKEYIGDSITVFENGDITSNNFKLQGTISHVLNNDKEYIKGITASNHLPFQYNLYCSAAGYYRVQYPEEFKKVIKPAESK